MSSATDIFRQLLKEQGYNVTNARLAVFKALVGHEPMSMRTLVERSGAIDRASVYRAIDLFEKLGIVQRLNTGWKYRLELTDKFTDHHHHLTCTQCGKTTALNEDELEAFIENIAHEYGFSPTSHQIEIQGICNECRVAGASPQAPEHL
jgi:Fur family ferric uptake transcriptional regulator